MAKVKICGVLTPDIAQHAERCGADWVGLVFVPESPRNVTLEEAVEIVAALEGSAEPVALLVNPDDDIVATMIGRLGIRDIQLHGQETPERVASLAGRFDARFWKAIGIYDRADLAQAGDYEAAHCLLLDARPPKGATRTGGHGQMFDWSLLQGWSAPRPWILAGGLDPTNVAEAIEGTGAEAVDVSTGVESRPMGKDRLKIRLFIERAKAAGHGQQP